MNWFVTVALMLAVPAKRTGETPRNAKNKNEFFILFMMVFGFQ